MGLPASKSRCVLTHLLRVVAGTPAFFLLHVTLNCGRLFQQAASWRAAQCGCSLFSECTLFWCLSHWRWPFEDERDSLSRCANTPLRSVSNNSTSRSAHFYPHQSQFRAPLLVLLSGMAGYVNVVWLLVYEIESREQLFPVQYYCLVYKVRCAVFLLMDPPLASHSRIDMMCASGSCGSCTRPWSSRMRFAAFVFAKSLEQISTRHIPGTVTTAIASLTIIIITAAASS